LVGDLSRCRCAVGVEAIGRAEGVCPLPPFAAQRPSLLRRQPREAPPWSLLRRRGRRVSNLRLQAITFFHWMNSSVAARPNAMRRSLRYGRSAPGFQVIEFFVLQTEVHRVLKDVR